MCVSACVWALACADCVSVCACVCVCRQDAARAAAAQSVLVQELKDSHQREIERLRASMAEASQSARGLETSELYRMREDVLAR